ncbi:uncharacterized protein (DUF302 family) [Marinirhabdus gelatinilytica]|uniref:Uncharacterized protein (DUF302 family) n=2 Tax=Marinirhabdus gelatinilytica TaxID=1703343 RepID=A0A370QLN7_9FLAO|nr:uncharacterized protein (DUF302 family) [Marinirhabdus gelatinilytica]
MKKILLFSGMFLLLACNDGSQVEAEVQIPETPGAAFSVSDSNFNTTYNTILDALEDNPNSTVVAQVNHTSNAQNAGLTLRNTRLILFGNPNLGTPVMQDKPLAGIDLPQKMLVYEDVDGNILVSYNATDYLVARHGVDAVETLPQIDNALENLATLGTNAEVTINDSADVSLFQGIISTPSANTFEETYTNLKTAIQDNPNLTIIAEVDHKDNAQSVGLDLAPMRVIIFGNPSLGTPLMQSAQTTALDLPQKMMVWEDADGSVLVTFNLPFYLKERHDITDSDATLTQIQTALENLATGAAQ